MVLGTKCSLFDPLWRKETGSNTFAWKDQPQGPSAPSCLSCGSFEDISPKEVWWKVLFASSMLRQAQRSPEHELVSLVELNHALSLLHRKEVGTPEAVFTGSDIPQKQFFGQLGLSLWQ